jgi:hypothetical protein
MATVSFPVRTTTVMLCSLAACGGGGGGASDAGLGDPEVLAGTFEIELVYADTPYTSMIGTVYDGGSPAAVVWEQADADGPCVLVTPRVPFCSTPCGGSAVCVEDETCVAYPTAQDVGTVAVSGVSTSDGASAFDMRLVAGNYQLPTGVSLDYPPFAEGDEVRIDVDGGALTGPFALTAAGIAPLALTSQDLALERDTALALQWEPAGAGADTTLMIKLDISHHGGTRGKIECAAPDSGSLDIAAGLINQLIDLGTAGFPTIVLGRTAIGSAVIASGRVDLTIASELEVAVDVPGVVSCTDSNQCPDGQTCQDDLTCG